MDGGVISMDAKTYNFHIMSRSRSFPAFVLFTANDARYGCHHCSEVEAEFRLVAQAYWAKRDVASSTADDVAFIRIAFDNARNVFVKHKLNNVPVLAWMPVLPTSASAEQRATLEAKNQMTSPNGGLSAEDIASFLQRRTGEELEIKRSPIMGLIFLLLLLAAGAGVAHWAIENGDTLAALRDNRALWMAVAFMLYFLSVSGIMYDIIRGVGAFHVDQQGRIMLFHPSGNQQFAAEGLIIGGMNLAAALLLIYVADKIPRWKSSGSRSIALWLALFGFFFVYSRITALYTMKNRWYRVW
eukprot:PLAT5782.1.p1 GENE.PLAT5782.1~~PLAT5782.1.p1  ORF type:complete len:346 (+),score=150.80 PLAT5782.1:143-1039(+)